MNLEDRKALADKLTTDPVTPHALSEFCYTNRLSYAQLGRILKVERHTVGSWLNGSSRPPHYLGLALNELQRRINDNRSHQGF